MQITAQKSGFFTRLIQKIIGKINPLPYLYRYVTDNVGRLKDKLAIRIAPRKKRTIKVVLSTVFLFIIPVLMVHFGYIFLHKQGGLMTAVSDATDLRIRNVSVGVYHLNKPIDYSNWHINPEHIKSALPFNVGEYTLGADPEKIRQSILNVPWVKNAKVKLQLPDSVIISVEENIPYALWQVDGGFYLIDEAGNIITDQNLERYDYLPWVVGSDANRYVRDYVMMMNDFADIFTHVKASYRIGNRRWNLLLNNNIEISLSEQNPRASLEKLMTLQNKYNILNKQISAIDLRIPSKIFLRKSTEDSMQPFDNNQSTG